MSRLIALLFSCSLFCSGPSIACDCDELSTIQEKFKKASIVFSGLMIKKEKINFVWGEPYSIIEPNDSLYKIHPVRFVLYRYSFVSYSYYKGKYNKKEQVDVIGGSGMCEFEFRPKLTYIIYARVSENIKNGKKVSVYFTDKCSRTPLFENKEAVCLKNIALNK